jgi:hypothetical protein
MVQKSINYASYDDLTLSSNNEYVSNLSNWRNIIAFAADDWEEGMFHMQNTENISVLMEKDYPYLNIEKIYCDALKKESSSGGARYTEATKAINARFNKGCLMFSYFGHSGDDGWSHERILMRSDINKWTNKYCLPFVYTAGCTFARYDKIAGTSPAEDMLKTEGGAIALITSTRNSFSSTNETFGKRIYTRAFEQTNVTMGEIHAKAYMDVNGSGAEMYVLLGDPSATLAHPKFNVVTDSINAVAFNVFNDTIKALQFVTIKGHITDNANTPLNNFNGWVYPAIYDKMDSVSTINPLIKDGKRFPLQKSIIFKGKSNIKDGYFSFSFMTPKDINYEYGLGKISYYAMSTEKTGDAKGYDQVPIGGMKDTNINDNDGPEISLYFNEPKFVNGGLTSTTPFLYAKISDANGINTTGAGIGHDIVAVVDGDMSKSMTLNDVFEYDENSFVSGSLNCMVGPLDEGTHTLTLRAWDVVNNMGENTINFEVVKDEDLKIKHVLNYPNPFTTSTQFFFEHNRPNTPLQVRVQIFTISGKVVKTIILSQQNMGFRSDPIHWNGLDDFGDKLARGIYIYKLQVITPDGKSAEKIEKIAIL